MNEKTGAERIAAERERQIKAEGYTREHDQKNHMPYIMMEAARAYILAAQGKLREAEQAWPWDKKLFKYDCSSVRCLEKAGALTAAAIDLIEPVEKKEPNACSSCSDDAIAGKSCRDCEQSKKW